MARTTRIEYIGWEDDFRYVEEKRRLTEHIDNLAKEKGFAYACVQSVSLCVVENWN
jgi:hypothetical protein